MELALQTKMFIGGAFTSGATGEVDPVINPATEEVIAQAPVGGMADAEAALAAAQDSFANGPWRRMTPRQRVEKMQAFYDALDRRKEAIVRLLIAEAGATVALANGAQWANGMKHFRYALEYAGRDFTKLSMPELTPGADGRKILGTSIVRRDPVGVVAAITPYNYPFMLNMVKVVPALLMGNSVVLKPSPYTPFSALLFGDAAVEAGLPEGILNVITGAKDVGEKLTTDKRVKLVTFTGSDMVGAAIMAQAAPTLKRLLLELGGKSAMIVRADGDLDRAAAAGLSGFTSHCGQGCALMTRHLVHNSVRAQYVEKLKALAERVTVGDPADPATKMGPLIRAAQRDRVEHYVQAGIDSGARLVTGGKRPAHLNRGFFFEPTLFDDVDNTSSIAQDEIFGPVGAVIGFDTDEEAISIANDSEFGLAASIFSADAGRAYEIVRQIDTGRAAINGGSGTQLSDEPFGGNGRSGYGRENGIEGLLEFTNANAISFHAA
jgi:acyl-CoA reductase-like NAD-dependent aldehyde dehydrogenase